MDDLKMTQEEPQAQETPTPELAPPAGEAETVAVEPISDTAPTDAEAAPPAAEPEPEAEDKTPDKEPDATNELEQTRATMTSAIDIALKSTVRAAAVEAGIKAERVDYAVRLADLSGIDILAADAQEKIATAIGKVLADVPELKGTVGVGTGSLGNHARQSTKTLDAFERGFLGMDKK